MGHDDDHFRNHGYIRSCIRISFMGRPIAMTKVMITGGSGSFGQAFTEYLLTTKIERIVIFSRGEHAQEEMARRFTDPRIRYFIGDVRDRKRLELAMFGIDTVVHAAALKVVPVAEYNPTECLATNIGGAENVVMAAISSGVSRVLGLSTDKAVNPINLYGASKLAAEKVFIAANNLSAGRCRFSVVRYGNVAGSRGSVLPLFMDLIAKDKDVVLPITDERMTRFWITMARAIHMVNIAHTVMKGREIFVPVIPSIKVLHLAWALNAKHKQVGIRPGEKLHEVLITEDESFNTVYQDHHSIIYPSGHYPDGFCHPDVRRYASDTNPVFLKIEDIKEYIYGKPLSRSDHHQYRNDTGR
jgi:UDP-N-acetylglucosamine 4,6-dehydratase/5-epimerase